ncbi:MAG: polysaccharide biosynthesis/export family protein [Pseudomonadota bacterium]
MNFGKNEPSGKGMIRRRVRDLAGAIVAGSLMFGSVVGSAQGQDSTAGQAADANLYHLDTGDQVRVTVFGHDDLSGQFEVDTKGAISFPLIGEVHVVEKTPGEVEQQIVGLLRPDYLKNPQVSVEVTNYRPFYIIGEVANPGSYAYVGGMRVVNAVAMAGGFTYRADEDDLIITRASDPNGQKQAAEQNTIVRPGDVIEVPERFF